MPGTPHPQAAELEQQAREVRNSWIAQDAPPTEPTVVPPIPPAPEPAPGGAEHLQVEPAPATVQTRRPDGTFGPRAPADSVPPGRTPVTPAAAAAPATPPPAGASAAEVQEYIEALLNDQPHQIPKGVRVPLKRGEEVVYEPIEEVIRGGMRMRDYHVKTQALTERLAEIDQREADMEARAARMAAREAYLQEQEKLLREANLSPEGHESLQEHFRQMETNPLYRKRVEEALAAREDHAELEALREREHREAVYRGAETALGWIEDLAADPRFQGVDKERVREIYAAALEDERLPLDRRAVEHIFASEAEHVSQTLGPLQREVAELTAQVKALTGQTGADRHNAQTAHAVRRGAAPPTQPVGTPPAPAGHGPVRQFSSRELPEINREWASRR